MLTNTKNTTVTLSNDFVQQPQAPFSVVEMRLFHVALLQIHQRETSFKPLYSVLITDVIERKGRNYALLTEAITSLKNRIWFGQNLFLSLEHVKNEGVIEFVLNPALTEHLLCKNGWFATIDVAELYERGLTHATGWRLLWLLRSWYRPLAKVKEKKLTIVELETLFFGGDKPFPVFGSLHQHFKYAEKALLAAGIEVTLKSDKRGLVGKGLKFIIPLLSLKKKTRLKKAIEAAVETITNTVAEVVDVVTKVAVATPVVAAMAVAAPVAEGAATPTVPTEAAPNSMGHISGLMNKVLQQSMANAQRLAPVPEPAREDTIAVASLPGAPVIAEHETYYTMLVQRWQLYTSQINKLRTYIAGNKMKYDNVRAAMSNINTKLGASRGAELDSLGAFVWSQLREAMPALYKY